MSSKNKAFEVQALVKDSRSLKKSAIFNAAVLGINGLSAFLGYQQENYGASLVMAFVAGMNLSWGVRDFENAKYKDKKINELLEKEAANNNTDQSVASAEKPSADGPA